MAPTFPAPPFHLLPFPLLRISSFPWSPPAQSWEMLCPVPVPGLGTGTPGQGPLCPAHLCGVGDQHRGVGEFSLGSSTTPHCWIQTEQDRMREQRVCCGRLLIIWRSLSLFLIKYKDYLTVIISTRWPRITEAASKACLGGVRARFAPS